MKRECETCVKNKLIYCPSSIDCLATDDKPYYQNRIMILEENWKLKKQLENCYCNRTDCSARIKDSKQYDSLVQKTEKQQKEFIEYLEDEIYTIEPKGTLINFNCDYDSEEDYIRGVEKRVKLDTLKNNLSKYKEIIGGKE